MEGRVIKMKKGLTKVITAMIVLVLAFGAGVTIISADDMLIGRELEIEGVGIVDIDLEVQTEKYCDGLKLSDRTYTPAGGYRGPTYVLYSSELEMGRYNDTENVTMDMEYTQTINIENAKGKFSSKNYLIGSATGYKYAGNVKQDMSVYTDNSLSETIISGSVEGDMTLAQKVVDPVTRIVIVKDVSNFIGTFNYNYSAYIEHTTYPASGNEDPLGCP
jgi:hypothetical protein